MNSDEISFLKRIVVGINYLYAEASNNGAHEVAHILNKCISDICHKLENGSQDSDQSLKLIDSNLFAAINFLTRFAALRDDQEKEEIVAGIVSVQRALN